MTDRTDPRDRDALLDALLDADRPEPSPDFDDRFRARLAAERAASADPPPDPREAALDRLLDADRPEPSPGFDDRFRARLARERRAGRLRGRGRVRPWLGALGLAAAAAVAAFVVWPRAVTPDREPFGAGADPELLAHLDMLEVYGEIEALEALEDEETFELIARLDRLETEIPR